MMAAPFFVVGAAISKESLGGAGAWALIISGFSIGAFAGGFVALHLRPSRPFVASFLGYLPFGLPSVSSRRAGARARSRRLRSSPAPG